MTYVWDTERDKKQAEELLDILGGKIIRRIMFFLNELKGEDLKGELKQ